MLSQPTLFVRQAASSAHRRQITWKRARTIGLSFARGLDTSGKRVRDAYPSGRLFSQCRCGLVGGAGGFFLGLFCLARGFLGFALSVLRLLSAV